MNCGISGDLPEPGASKLRSPTLMKMKKPYWMKRMARSEKIPSPLIRRCLALFLCFCTFVPGDGQAQRDSTGVDRKKLNALIIAAGAGYTAGLITLNHVWYKDTERQPFRFFNDNAEWK